MLTFTLFFGLMLYFLFFFVRDWEQILDGVVRAVPLGDARERRLFAKFAEVSRATMKGTLVVAAVQGAIGGVLFAIVGIEAAVFWGVVMTVFSLLPAFGAALIWGPAAILLIATGAVWEGIVLIIGGAFVIGLADNFLRPLLVGHETKMPDYLVLLSTLGGLAVFGIAGVVIGPLVAALFLVVWEMLAEEYVPLDTTAPPVVPATPISSPDFTSRR
jgi:predicted PurR-regulated permease PerM